MNNTPDYWVYYYAIPVNRNQPLWKIFDEVKREVDNPENGFPEEMKYLYPGIICFN